MASNRSTMSTMADTTRMSAEMRSCISDCTACAALCSETLSHCLERGGRLADAALLHALIDCAEICRTAAAFMERGSALHGEVCRACAEICAACARLCTRAGDDPRLQDCAEACLRAASSCKQMAEGMARPGAASTPGATLSNGGGNHGPAVAEAGNGAGRRAVDEDAYDKTLADSYPASDPPSTTSASRV